MKVEKAMAPHSSTLAWKIPWMEEPGRLQSMGSLSWIRLSNFTFTFHFHALEKATHSSVLAWRIPGTGEPGRCETQYQGVLARAPVPTKAKLGKEPLCGTYQIRSDQSLSCVQLFATP